MNLQRLKLTVVLFVPAYFHNGAFTRLEDALRFHLGAATGAPAYDPAQAGVDTDLQGPLGPTQPVLARLDPPVQTPVALKRGGVPSAPRLRARRSARPARDAGEAAKASPQSLPSGRPVHNFR